MGYHQLHNRNGYGGKADHYRGCEVYRAGSLCSELDQSVTEIKSYLFANTEFMESFDFTVDMPVGDYAFYTVLSRYNGFVNLIIGENVPTMGKGAFHYRDIENLTYNAVSAKNANVMTNEAEFFGCEIGSLTIGDTVELLDA